jgi:hypothetical protein
VDCGQIHSVLARLSPNGDLAKLPPVTTGDSPAIEELVRRGLAQEVRGDDRGAAELGSLRSQLVESQQQEVQLRIKLAERQARGAGPSWFDSQVRDLSRQIDAIEKREIELRRRILDLSESAAAARGGVAVGPKRYSLTFAGRELLRSLGPRLGRVSRSPLEAFEREMSGLRENFSRRAAKAFEMLKWISPRIADVDEIHLRGAAVGLASRSEPAAVLSEAYVAAYEALRHASFGDDVPRALDARRALVAEVLCLTYRDPSAAAMPGAVQSMVDLTRTIRTGDQQWRPWVTTTEQSLSAALMLLDDPPQRRAEVASRATALASALDNRIPGANLEVSAAVLLAEGVQREDDWLMQRLAWLYQALYPLSSDRKETSYAAAILTIAGGDDLQSVHDRFAVARDYLRRFSDNGMVVPGALLSVLCPEVEEALDNLRTASSEVSRHRLSLGGMENLSLGMKLLMQISLAPPGLGERRAASPASPSGSRVGALGLLELAVASPVVAAAFDTFHESSLHKLAVLDSGFHPVHANFVYSGGDEYGSGGYYGGGYRRYGGYG